jgi:hypothetical protein
MKNMPLALLDHAEAAINTGAARCMPTNRTLAASDLAVVHEHS